MTRPKQSGGSAGAVLARPLRLVVASGLAALLLFAPAANAAEPSGVLLNEIACAGTDWVEILNRGSTEASLGSWLLTDDPLDRVPLRDSHRLRFASDTTLAPGARLVVAQGTDGFSFGLSCGDDTVRLADASDALVDAFTLPVPASEGTTLGRLPDGTGDWVATAPTPGAANVAAIDESDDPSWLYDPYRVTEIDLEADEAALAQLAAAPEEYVAADIVLRNGDDTYGPYLVGLRLKGHGSFRTLEGKSAFKVKFGFAVPGQRFQGLKGLTLDNMVQDPSMIAEATSSLLVRAAGVPTARVGYAYVRLNGADYGLYADVENVDAVMAGRWFAGTQHIYEADSTTDVGPGRAAEFEVDEGSTADVADLDALAAADSGGAEGWWERLQPVADLVELTSAWATEHYIGHWDGYSVAAGQTTPNNYYLHSDPAGRFSLIPTGTDQTWRDEPAFGAYGNGVLMRHCVADATCRELYVDALRRLGAEPAVAAVPTQVREIRDAIAPWRARDPRREQSVQAGEAQADAALQMLENRPAQLAAWLANPSFVDVQSPPAASDESGGVAPEIVQEPQPVPPPPVVPAPPLSPPPPVRPVLGKPIVVPAKPVAGRRFTLALRVARSDTHAPFTTGRVTCTPTLAGKRVAHSTSFRAGVARLRLVIPKSASGKLLKVGLTIKAAGRSTHRTYRYTVR